LPPAPGDARRRLAAKARAGGEISLFLRPVTS
jgi:hypothetical protein